MFYVVNYYGGLAGDKVYRQALKEARGKPTAAIQRLGPAYVDAQGNLIRLTLNRSIRREGKARGLPNYQLGNSILSKVNEIESIEHLAIGFPTWIDDAGMKHIAKMPNLKSLSLKFTKLTPKGLNNLLPLKSLQLLVVDGTKLSDDDARAFEQAMPDCEVILWPKEAATSQRQLQMQSDFIDAVRAGRLRLVEPPVR